ncbi:hypothetical protein N1030_08230 [Desulfovibrio mangrovi]|uniref:hypothetical protein n=1 Tax=Desulfovibrio mangrovi TaxID=2976983 RepID=UPI002246F0B5|nr:hypothetical protein [Desulfovibrio mangrovi]UZP68944.1 hypothetical protein N1030_08230 [Desulfovibrio mangrovi]
METVLRPATGEASGLPFTGLGHDLAPVAAHAALLEWVPAPRKAVLLQDPSGLHPTRPETLPAVAGFGLLVALGREIRGR